MYSGENKHFFMHENSLKIMESHKMLGFLRLRCFQIMFYLVIRELVKTLYEIFELSFEVRICMRIFERMTARIQE